MSNYIIGIGGSGAKCVEALVQMCAAGLMPDRKNLSILFVDPDTGNGNLIRARTLINQYQEFRLAGLGDKNEMLKTALFTAGNDQDTWSPVDLEAADTLGKIFKYNVINADPNQKHLAQLFDVLYTEDERDTDLDKGFRGHPSIGAAVMTNTLKLDDAEPWRTFRNNVSNDITNGLDVNIFFAGSIFGGTGAAGFPTIPRLIRNEFNNQGNLKIGGALMLPYFSFIPGIEADNNGLKASSEYFLLNTRASLEYYANQNYDQIYDAIYILGYESLKQMKDFSIGASTQRNEPHLLEMYAALAAIRFFSSDDAGSFIIGKANKDGINWGDFKNVIQNGNGQSPLYQKLTQFSRFAYAFLTVYYPALEEIRGGGDPTRASWYWDFFEKRKVNIRDKEVADKMEHVKQYCKVYLDWMKDIHDLEPEAVTMLNKYALDNIGDGNFNSLLTGMADDEKALKKIWNRMCAYNLKDKSSTQEGRFLNALYDCCQIDA